MAKNLINNVAVIGQGYVGCAVATLLSQQVNTIGFDIDTQKISSLRAKKSPIKDDDLSTFWDKEVLRLQFRSMTDFDAMEFDTIIISTPTDFDDKTENFNTSSIEQIITKVLKQNPNANIVIKSTVPIGYTEKMRAQHNYSGIYFCPEFLREGKALYDNLYPDRIIIGGSSEFSMSFVELLKKCSRNQCSEIMVTEDPTEAECIKLFSNTYIAMRVAFFNEIDRYCMLKNLNSLEIISGIGLDKRIGNHYNNPSFGFGGYCLPKDSKQAKTELAQTPSRIISSVYSSNADRIQFIAEQIMTKKPKSVGLYQIGMKTGSDNSREAAILHVVKILIEQGVRINFFDAFSKQQNIPEAFSTFSDLGVFANESDIIITNRIDADIDLDANTLFSRDLFHVN